MLAHFPNEEASLSLGGRRWSRGGYSCLGHEPTTDRKLLRPECAGLRPPIEWSGRRLDSWRLPEFVRARVAAGIRILDFGAGTGTDAAWYVQQGHRVLAFDNSEGMLTELRRKCSDEIQRRRIEVWSGSYESFLADVDAHGAVQAVTANFAVVNLLPDPGAWFAALRRTLPVGDPVLISIYNALHPSELKRPRFWLSAARRAFEPGIPFWEAESAHFRYWPWSIAKLAKGFRVVSMTGPGSLSQFIPGPGDWRRPHSLGERVEQRIWQKPPWNHFGRFVFLELRKCP